MIEKGFMYRYDFEGLYLRKNAFKTINFDPAKIKLYDSLIKKFTWKTYSYNRYLFHKVGFEQEDVEAIGWSYVYTFFATPSNAKFNSKLDEYRVLHCHLRQRYAQLIIFINRKAKGIVDSENYTEGRMEYNNFEHTLNIDHIGANSYTPETHAIDNEFSKKINGLLKEILDEVYPANEDRIASLKMSDIDFKKICLFHMVSYYKTREEFTNTVVLDKWVKRKIKKNINEFMIKIERSYRKNDIKKVEKKVNKILELDFEA